MRDGREGELGGALSVSGVSVNASLVASLFWRWGLVFRRSRNAAAGAATWVVDDGGGADFVSIQAAVDATGDGDTIEMRAMV